MRRPSQGGRTDPTAFAPPGATAPQKGSSTFRMSSLFPVYNGKRAPFPKQLEVIEWIRSGAATGGGVVYQGGKGSGKTLVGSATIIWIHHQPQWRGCRSVIGRETYPSLVTSTADEFFKMVEQLPTNMVKAAVRPTKGSMGHVEWMVGGVTLLCSLSNSDTWESANLGAVWVDEAHRQNPKIIGDLETRLRQQEGPRCAILTTNPGGKGWIWRMAAPDSPHRRSNWLYIQAATTENPALPSDYHDRLIQRYGKGTPAYRRWVGGESAALEGTVFTEFLADVEACVHVVPPMDLPKTWRYGRGLDYGLVNPTAVVWAGLSDDGDWWVDMMHYAPAEPEDRELWTVAKHADAIKAIDSRYPKIEWMPADPSIFAKIHTSRTTGAMYSTADEFFNHGVMLSQADNDRESGLGMLLDLISVNPKKYHPVTLELGSPSLYILDRECNAPLIDELSTLLWAKPEGSNETGRPDDVQKKHDHAYDAIRYLVKDAPTAYAEKEAVREPRSDQQIGSRGKTRRY